MKIFILEPSFLHIGNDICEKLTHINTDLTICKKYSSNKEYINSENVFIKYMDIEEINLAFKNNSLLYINYNNNDISCISSDNFTNANLVPIKYNEFNNIIPSYYENSLIIWLDEKHIYDNKKQQKQDISSANYLEENIHQFNLKYLYFSGESIDKIVSIINEYILGNTNKRNELENEYS